MISKALSSIVGVCLILLLVVGPGFMADKLERIETAQSGLVSFDEMISEMTVNETIMGYEPYVQLNSTTENHHYIAPFTQPGVYFIDYSTYRGMDTLTYDLDGYKDYFISSRVMTQSPTRLVHQMEVDLEQWLIDGVDEFYFMFNYPGDYFIQALYFRGFNGENPLGGAYEDISYPSGWLTPDDGENVFTFDISETDILNGITDCELAEHIAIIVQVEFSVPYAFNTPMFSNLQINTEYFELTESEVFWSNSTITTYQPFTQSITSYSIHKITLGIGGVLLCSIAVISTPFINFRRKK
jgi:hypothetical protein